MGHAKLVTANPAEAYPEFLRQVAQKTSNPEQQLHPLLVDMSAPGAPKKLEQLLASEQIASIVDNYDEQYAELLLSKNAHLYRANYDVQVASIEKLLTEHYGLEKPWRKGCWVYYPWSKQLIHLLAQGDFEDLRTIRNRDLITAQEQKTLFEFSTACFGMSVGSASALALGISGISRRMKLIDGAVISGSNLNRILTGVESVGKSKAEVIGHRLYEMNPYSQVQFYEKANRDNIAEILDSSFQTNLVVDEIDDIEMKIQIRLEARKRKIPVIMATELGDTVMLDVERFDKEPNRALFHNLIPGAEGMAESNLANYREWAKAAVKIIDPANMPIKMQASVLKIGMTIVTHPQLGSTVMITEGSAAFAAKSIALGHRLDSGRYVISLRRPF